MDMGTAAGKVGAVQIALQDFDILQQSYVRNCTLPSGPHTWEKGARLVPWCSRSMNCPPHIESFVSFRTLRLTGWPLSIGEVLAPI